MSAAQLIAGVGQYSFWGSSASFDFLDVMKDVISNSSDDDLNRPIRILIVNASDIRHILTTISNKFRKSITRPIEFCMLDTPIEVLARNILLLEVLNDYDVPIRTRANTFLEIYGNAKIQERTSRYIEELATQLRLLVAHNRGRLAGLIDFSMMKYKEKDMLEDCFKSYISSSYPFDIEHYRDYRMRGLYGDRYDSRLALADWDYHESIRSRASIIHIRQYKDWRNTGIAFEFGDQQYTCPNRTLMAYAEGYIKHGKEQGMKKEVKGYWGDIVNSPYYSFGIDCETRDKASSGLFEIMNKDSGSEQHRHHTVEVALYNIVSYLHQIETREVYDMKVEHDIFSGLGEKSNPDPISSSIGYENATIVELDDSDKEQVVVETTASADVDVVDDGIEDVLSKKRAMNILESFKGIKIIPIVGPASEKLYKSKYDHYFDAAFISAKHAQLINDDSFYHILSPDAVVAVETAKFYQPLAKQAQKQEFVRKMDEYATTQPHPYMRIPAPVFRRHRDEADTEDDVIFFSKAT